MQKAAQEFYCWECQHGFDSASSLLQHFALHASRTMISTIRKSSQTDKLKKLPDLFPIELLRKVRTLDSDRESDSGIEDVNPIKFCLVTMSEEAKTKKYECNFCSRKFGWPTDLKRHTFIHTGEKPFQCQFCESAFTRNFLLKKHTKKYHSSDEEKGKSSDCKPGKPRKQEKWMIRRKINSTKVD